jgi:putative membrane protein
MNYNGHVMWGFGLGNWAMVIAMVVFWVVVIVGIIFFIKWLAERGGGGSHVAPPREESALDILKKRYARGEINKEEFEQKRKDLMT